MFRLNQTWDLFPGFSLPFQLCTSQQPHQQLSPSPTLSPDHFDELGDDDSIPPGESKKRKIMHRDVERHRRQEIATLHTSLRSLLPLEYTKGKRSVSDHMEGALNYIKHLRRKTEELSKKRDSLQKICKATSDSNNAGAIVTVRTSCWGGIEFVIVNIACAVDDEQGLALSRVLQLLIREGLSIINCNSAKVKDRSFHTIESEVVNGGRKIDLSELQQKLRSLISQSSILDSF